jgi:filamentous hemagglutinin family protein
VNQSRLLKGLSLRLSLLLAGTSWLAFGLVPPTARSQIIPDHTANTIVDTANPTAGEITTITGGTTIGNNLLHSFQEFSLPTGTEAFFNNSTAIANIFSRITGNNASNIDGLIRANGSANLFLLNPNGILFGENARLDLGGSFLATTANSLVFENGLRFSASDPQLDPLLTLNIPIGLQFGNNPGSITNLARATDQDGGLIGGLDVKPGHTLALVGSNLNIDNGILLANAGHIALGSVVANELVGIELAADGRNFSFTYDPAIAGNDILITNGAIVEASNLNSDLASGSIQIRGADIAIDNASGVITANSSDLDGGDIFIVADNLSVLNGSFIVANVFDTGAGGDVIIAANNFSVNNSAIGTATFDAGRGGNVSIAGNSLSILNGAGIEVLSVGTGKGGDLSVQINGDILLQGGTTGNTDLFFFENRSHLATNAALEGDSGRLTIRAQNLSLRDGGLIFAGSTGVPTGRSGGLEIIVADHIEVVGQTADLDVEGISNISTNTESNAPVPANQIVDRSGDLNIQARSLSLQDGGRITSLVFGSTAGNTINIAVDEAIEIVGFANVSDAEGNFSPTGSQIVTSNLLDGSTPGNININTGSLLLRDGGQIDASTFSNDRGGDITIQASDQVEVTGRFIDTRLATGILSRSGLRFDEFTAGNSGNILLITPELIVTSEGRIATNTLGFGSAGNINIQVDRLQVLNGGDISASTANSGRAGNIEIIATESVEVSGKRPFPPEALQDLDLDVNLFSRLDDNSLISTEVAPNAAGQGGNIVINAPLLLVFDDGEIAASTLGTGNAGNINLNVDRLRVLDGAQIEANTLAVGNGGRILINANELVEVKGGQPNPITDPEGALQNSLDRLPPEQRGELLARGKIIQQIFRSSINTDVSTDATGQGGDIVINTPQLLVLDGGEVSSATFGVGNAGNIEINAGLVELKGFGAPDIYENRTLENTSVISVEGFFNTGAAGNLIINASQIRLADQADLAVSTFGGDRGNITINASDLRMRDGSKINANAGGVATGGNIFITTDTLVALENSDITANSVNDFGGQVAIDAAGIFGTANREVNTPQSDITASSSLGAQFSGIVEINTPDVDPAQGLVQLSTDTVDVSALIDRGCLADREVNQLVITGRGGIPANPTEVLGDRTILEDLGGDSDNLTNLTNSPDQANLSEATKLDYLDHVDRSDHSDPHHAYNDRSKPVTAHNAGNKISNPSVNETETSVTDVKLTPQQAELQSQIGDRLNQVNQIEQTSQSKIKIIESAGWQISDRGVVELIAPVPTESQRSGTETLADPDSYTHLNYSATTIPSLSTIDNYACN